MTCTFFRLHDEMYELDMLERRLKNRTDVGVLREIDNWWAFCLEVAQRTAKRRLRNVISTVRAVGRPGSGWQADAPQAEERQPKLTAHQWAWERARHRRGQVTAWQPAGDCRRQHYCRSIRGRRDAGRRRRPCCRATAAAQGGAAA